MREKYHGLEENRGDSRVIPVFPTQVREGNGPGAASEDAAAPGPPEPPQGAPTSQGGIGATDQERWERQETWERQKR